MLFCRSLATAGSLCPWHPSRSQRLTLCLASKPPARGHRFRMSTPAGSSTRSRGRCTHWMPQRSRHPFSRSGRAGLVVCCQTAQSAMSMATTRSHPPTPRSCLLQSGPSISAMTILSDSGKAISSSNGVAAGVCCNERGYQYVIFLLGPAQHPHARRLHQERL